MPQDVNNATFEATDSAGDDMFNYKVSLNAKLIIQPWEQMYVRTIANIHNSSSSDLLYLLLSWIKK